MENKAFEINNENWFGGTVKCMCGKWSGVASYKPSLQKFRNNQISIDEIVNIQTKSCTISSQKEAFEKLKVLISKYENNLES